MPGLDMPKLSFKYTDWDDEKQRRKLISWLNQLEERLRYLLENIDEENLSESMGRALEETRTAIQLTAKGLEAAQATIQLLPDEIRIAIEGIDEFHTEGQGTEILLTKEQARIITPEFVVSIPNTDDDTISLQIDKDGAVMDYLSVGKKLVAPNMAEKYTGPSTIYVGPRQDYETLQEAFSALNDKVITGPVTVWLQTSLRENATLSGVMGGGTVIVTGESLGQTQNVFTGTIRLNNCRADVRLYKFRAEGMLYLSRCDYVEIDTCEINGNGARALRITEGSRSYVRETTLYNADELIYLGPMAELHAYSLQGASASGGAYLVSEGGRWTWSGTRPDGLYDEISASLHSPEDPDTELTVDTGGTAPTPAPPESQTTTINLTATTYCRGSNWDNSGRWQGAVGSVNYKTCLWFDLTALAGKTVLSAMLTLTRLRAGGSGPVELHLYNTPIILPPQPALPSGDPLTGRTNRDVIGTIANGERMAFPVAAAAVQQMISGGGLMLYQDEESRSVGYSKNYASFGQSGGDAPVLTVTYK